MRYKNLSKETWKDRREDNLSGTGRWRRRRRNISSSRNKRVEKEKKKENRKYYIQSMVKLISPPWEGENRWGACNSTWRKLARYRVNLRGHTRTYVSIGSGPAGIDFQPIQRGDSGVNTLYLCFSLAPPPRYPRYSLRSLRSRRSEEIPPPPPPSLLALLLPRSRISIKRACNTAKLVEAERGREGKGAPRKKRDDINRETGMKG